MDTLGAQSYLQVCSKLVKEGQYSADYSSCNAVYDVVVNEYLQLLKEGCYDNAPAIAKQYNHLLDRLEMVLTVPELRNKKLVFCNDGVPPKMIGFWQQDLYKEKLMPKNCRVPVLLIPGENVMIEAVGKTNKRVCLSREEWICFFENSSELQIDISAMVRMIIIHLPMTSESICFLYGKGTGLEETAVKTISVKMMQDCADANVIQDILQSPDCFYGYAELAKCLNLRVLSYYDAELQKCNTLQNALTDDIVRIGNDKADVLKTIREDERNRKVQLQKEKAVIVSVIDRIEKLLHEIEKSFGTSDNVVCSEGFADTVYGHFFFFAEQQHMEAAECCANILKKYNHPGTDVISRYLDVAKDGFVTTVDITSGQKDIKVWYDVKMQFAVSNLELLDKKEIKNMLIAIDGHLSSGKELYFNAITLEKQRNKIINELMESLSKGYLPAAAELNKRYSNVSRVKAYLLESLVPETCIEAAEGLRYSSERKEFLFCKMLAAQGDIKAAKLYAEALFARFFDAGKQIDKATQNRQNMSKGTREKLDNGLVLITLCDYLIEQKYWMVRCKEMKGVTLFCLRRDYGSAMTCLHGIGSDISSYCRAKMYENGLGTSKDLEKAKRYYEKINEKDKFHARQAVARLKAKLEEQKAKEDDDYDGDQDYEESTGTVYVGSSGWCFITTAASISLHKGDDCKELILLRKFRDTYMNATREGQILVAEYYRIAPLIVQEINSHEASEEVYVHIWEQYIQPCCEAIGHGEYENTMRLYLKMVLELAETYTVAVDEEIRDQYSRIA